MLPGVGTPVKVGFKNTRSRELWSDVSARFESLTLVEATPPASSGEILRLEELAPVIPHLQVLVLEGLVACGDLSMITSLKGSLRRIVMRRCGGISGISS